MLIRASTYLLIIVTVKSNGYGSFNDLDSLIFIIFLIEWSNVSCEKPRHCKYKSTRQQLKVYTQSTTVKCDYKKGIKIFILHLLHHGSGKTIVTFKLLSFMTALSSRPMYPPPTITTFPFFLALMVSTSLSASSISLKYKMFLESSPVCQNLLISVPTDI